MVAHPKLLEVGIYVFSFSSYIYWRHILLLMFKSGTQGFIQALKLMSILLKEIEFCDCEAIVIAAWSLGQIPGGVSGGKAPIFFGFLMSLKPLNSLQWH